MHCASAASATADLNGKAVQIALNQTVGAYAITVFDKRKPDELVAAHNSVTLERLFTQLTGGAELERRAEDFAKTFRP